MVVTEVEMEMEESFLHNSKACSSMIMTVEGIKTEVIVELDAKADIEMEDTSLGMVMILWPPQVGMSLQEK